MPYLGGASLSSVLTKLWAETSQPVSGSQLVHALESVESPKPSTFRRKTKAVVTAAPPEFRRYPVITFLNKRWRRHPLLRD